MDPAVAAIGMAEFVVAIVAATYLTRGRLREMEMPKVALLASGVFVAQMVNFPVGGGTTGHLIGGALFAILSGPVIAIVGMTVVIVIQALMFGDGGITSLGLNAVNMAVIAPLCGWGVYTFLKPMAQSLGRAGKEIAVGAAAWTSVLIASAACAAELSISNSVSGGAYGIPATVSFPAMLGYYSVIGVGEGIITAGAIGYLEMASAGFAGRTVNARVETHGISRVLRSRTVLAAAAMLIVFALALPFYFLYASEGRDGLEQTMADAGGAEGESYLSAPLDYGDAYLTALLAGILGFVAVSSVVIGALALMKRRRKEDRF
jgi:cobalt/nickel transport system permease protein